MFCWGIWRETSFVNRTALYEIFILATIELVEYDDNRRKVEFPKLIRATAKRETDKELCHIGCVKSGSFCKC